VPQTTLLAPQKALPEPQAGSPGPHACASFIEGTLQRLYDTAPVLRLNGRDRLVLFSDLHLGDGGPRDDFRPNALLVEAVLRDYYLARGFSLVLNGDIEELQRFRLEAVRAGWEGMFRLFDDFRRTTALYKITGNHDERLWSHGEREGLLEAPRLSVAGDSIFLFHGHQATIFFERFNGVAEFFVRSVANALRIANWPVTYDSRKRYLHRPLFESLSKIDTLKFRIEQRCRDYASASPPARSAIEKAIGSFKEELARLWEKDRRGGLRDSLYDSRLCIPCLFNSGRTIGKRGVTAIEIADGRIALVHWFDLVRSSRSLARSGASERLGRSDFFRTVLKQDSLAYIFSRRRLLA
jgi:UDP-2,3-diacylglucosamine pyrophosphatase LpxH